MISEDVVKAPACLCHIYLRLPWAAEGIRSPRRLAPLIGSAQERAVPVAGVAARAGGRSRCGRTLAATFGLIVLSPAHAGALADCARAFDTGEVLDATATAESAFLSLDRAAFTAARLAMEGRVECSSEILSPTADARIERVEAIGAFLDDRAARVPQALAGLFSAEPGHQIPTSLLPDGHPVRTLIAPAMLLLRDDPGLAMPVPTSGWIEVDGTHALVAPTQRSAVLQQIDGQGAVVATHFRWPDEDGFGWVAPAAPSTAPVGSPDLAARSRGAATPWTHRAPVLGTTAASVVASGVLYAIAANRHREFENSGVMDPGATDAERAEYRAQLEGMQARTNPIAYGCFAAAGLGLALGVVTVVTW